MKTHAFKKIGTNRRLIILLVLSLVYVATNAQLIVSPDSIAQSLVSILSAPGMITSNARLNAEYPFTGKFICPNCNLGLTSGIILATDSATCAQGPNDQPYCPHPPSIVWPGDTDLNNYAGVPRTFWYNGYAVNASILEFDVIPLGDTLRFKFVFASEEYPQYVCSGYNDVFAFFATGPKPGGGSYNKYNIALTPGTNLPVSINTINMGHPFESFYTQCTPQGLSDSSYYIDNGSAFYPLDTPVVPIYQSDPYYIQFNGFTVPLDVILPVIPCQSYHLKLVIEDIQGVGGTSAVFLQSGSLVSNSRLFIDTILYDNGDSSAVEGCLNGRFKIKVLPASSVPRTIYFSFGGTAVNGTDYPLQADSIIIPAGDTVGYVNINPLASSGNKYVRLYLLNNQCVTGNIIDSADLIISSRTSLIAGPDTIKCPTDTIQLHASGYDHYTWSPASGLSNTAIANPFCSLSGKYYITGTTGSCSAIDSVTIADHFSLSHIIDTGFCKGQSSIIHLLPNNIFAIDSPIIYQDNGQIISSSYGLSAGIHYLVATNTHGCIAYDTVLIPLILPLNADTSYTRPVQCFGGSDGVLAVTANNGYFPYNYYWPQFSSMYDSVNSALSVGVYSVIISDAKGCTDTVSASIHQSVYTLSLSVSPTDTTINEGNTVQINSLLSPTPTTAVTYQWTPSTGLSCTDCPNPISKPDITQDYILVVKYNTCQINDTIHVIVQNNHALYIPNSFTPNGDGVNDVFLVFGKSISSLHLKIFDRWGEKVFETDDEHRGWDGTYKGALQLSGIYVYELNASFFGGSVENHKGSITLIR